MQESMNEIKAYREKLKKEKKKRNILGGHLVRLIFDWLVVLITISSLIDTEILIFQNKHMCPYKTVEETTDF